MLNARPHPQRGQQGAQVEGRKTLSHCEGREGASGGNTSRSKSPVREHGIFAQPQTPLHPACQSEIYCSMAAIEYDARDDEMLDEVEEEAAPAPRLRSKVAPAKKQKGRGFKSDRDEEAAPPYTGGRYESLPAISGAGPLKCETFMMCLDLVLHTATEAASQLRVSSGLLCFGLPACASLATPPLSCNSSLCIADCFMLLNCAGARSCGGLGHLHYGHS